MRTALAGLFLLAAPAVAFETAPPQSFAKPVGGGKFVLVILQPPGRDFKGDLRKKYGQSGLYPADDPTTSVWGCSWTADWPSDVQVSADGTFAVRVPSVNTGERRWELGRGAEKWAGVKPPDGWPDQAAVFVYRNGKPVHTLAVKDVFDTSRFTNRDLYKGPVVEIESLDEVGIGVVTTAHQDGTRQTATIHLDSGEVVGGSLPDARRGQGAMTVMMWVVLGGLAVACGLAVWLVRRQGNRGPVAVRPDPPAVS